MRRVAGFCLAFTLALAGAAPGNGARANDAQDAVMALADEFLAGQLAMRPEIAYFVSLPIERHDGLTDISPAGFAAWHAFEDRLMERLGGISEVALDGTPHWILHGQLQEILESSIQLRVCKRELWSVNHMGGMQGGITRLAQRQPVATAEERDQALVRWVKVGAMIRQDIANLKRGIEQGYATPKSAVRRVIAQVEGLVAVGSDDSPLYDPARRAGDATFAAAFAGVIESHVLPALAAYGVYLREDYLAAARAELGIGHNPHGRECYMAAYRNYTTLQRTPEEVHALGLAAVNRYKQEVIEIGAKRYGTADFGEILARTKDDPANNFTGPDEIVAIYRATVGRAQAGVVPAFAHMPAQQVVVKPYPDYLAGTGMSARYERSQGDEPSIFRFDPATWNQSSRGSAEITAMHEAYPGHHLQIALAGELEVLHDTGRIAFNSAFVEGWARYAEALAEELGLYDSETALIERRSWPARGMVVDTGLHILGWSNEQTLAFLRESGRFTDEAGPRMLDRMAVLPAQLTAYDSGALEIFALRRMAEEALGEDFDLAIFHGKLLEQGVTPMWMLRRRIERWVGDLAR